MQEKRSCKNRKYTIISCKAGRSLFGILVSLNIVFAVLPLSVRAQEIDVIANDTGFVGEAEPGDERNSETSNNPSSQEASAVNRDIHTEITPTPSEAPISPEPDGFISGDTSASSPDANTIHVIIENGSTSDTDVPNTEPAGDDAMTGDDTSYGDVYTGSAGDGGSGSSSGEKILHKPQLLLEDSNISSQTLKAGTNQEMTVTFRNKSRSQNIYGLKISLSTETKGIEFDKNSFYVQRLTPGEAITLKQNISIAEDTPPGQATVTFALEYEDSKATAATGTETLTFNVTQPVRAELEASDIPSVFYTMDTVEIPVKALNLGRDIIYNAKVQLEAEGLNPKGTVFLGNVEAGTAAEGTIKIYVKGISQEDSRETSFTAKSSSAESANSSSDNGSDPSQNTAALSPDQITGKLILTYEDSSGTPYEVSVDFTSEVKESQIQSLKIDNQQVETNSWWYSIIAILAVLLMAIILFLIARLHKKSVLLEEARKAAAH